jgi:hypothetical protein
MEKHQAVPLTAEEIELIELWMERPPHQRTAEDVRAYTEWVVAQRPELLPKGPDDAFEYVMRVLAGSLEGA